MTPMKIVGMICLIACGICLFVAIERYNANAQNVEMIRQMGEAMGVEVRAGMPTISKYMFFFAALTGIGGAVLIAKGK